MAYSDELCKLVIANIEIIEEAPSVVLDVDATILNAINERIRDRIDALDGWDGVYSLGNENEDGKTVFRAPQWPLDDAGACLAWYELWLTSETEYWTTPAIGAKSSRLCFRFNSEKEFHGKNKKAIKAYYKVALFDNQELSKAGVIVLEDGTLAIPFNFDPNKVVEEYPDLDDCLKPLDDAFDKLIQVHPVFDKLVKELNANK
ncbi:hypothetical protein [Solidesulfovibrio carbinolicus]|uniref:hypothetical protein n=1 Tax=Solidesulfovibrio carbinolicus TaxID=296842 RepID=UPI0010137B75|nr:hypothetical protein [Solidesulfovibrio carbinolicus]